MNRDDIMALANQTAGQHWMDEAHVIRFAALVAAAEREACNKAVYEAWDESGSPDAWRCVEALRARGQQ